MLQTSNFNFNFHLPPFTFLSPSPTEPGFVPARPATRSCRPSSFHHPRLDRLSAYAQPSQISFSFASLSSSQCLLPGEITATALLAFTSVGGYASLLVPVPFSPPLGLPHMYLRFGVPPSKYPQIQTRIKLQDQYTFGCGRTGFYMHHLCRPP
jgi:hypothetical protein